VQALVLMCRPAAASRPPAGDALWLPNTTRPAWLDGSLPGDRGFDPLGLSKPAEYLQIDVSCVLPPAVLAARAASAAFHPPCCV
jgi:hypothetical protein